MNPLLPKKAGWTRAAPALPQTGFARAEVASTRGERAGAAPAETQTNLRQAALNPRHQNRLQPGEEEQDQTAMHTPCWLPLPRGQSWDWQQKGSPGKLGSLGYDPGTKCQRPPRTSSPFRFPSPGGSSSRRGGTGLPHPGKLGLGCGMGQNWEKNEGKSRGIRPSLLCKAVQQALSPSLQPPLTQG